MLRRRSAASALALRIRLTPAKPSAALEPRRALAASIRIRTARADDAAALLAIYAPIVRETAISFDLEPPTKEEMAARVQATLRHYPWLVAETAGGGVAGYASAHRFRERDAYLWSVETSVYVAAQARGGGVGSALYARLLAILAAQGFVRAYAGITLPNPASEALHAGMGFVRYGVERGVGWKLGRWHDVARWERALQSPSPLPPAAPVPFADLAQQARD